MWALAFVYFGIVYGLYALGFFLPTIIKGFEQQFGTSYSLLERGLINAVPYAVALRRCCGGPATVTGAESGSGTSRPAFIGGAAIPVALYLSSPAAAMAAVTVCAVGVMCALPTFWALPTAFLTGAAAASGIAVVNSVGNTAGFAAPYVTGWLADLTGSQKTGLWLVGAVMIAAGAAAVVLRATQEPAAARAPDGRGLKTRVHRRTAT